MKLMAVELSPDIRTRPARRCAGSARRSGASPAVPAFTNGKQQVSEYSHAENDSGDPSHFDVESRFGSSGMRDFLAASNDRHDLDHAPITYARSAAVLSRSTRLDQSPQMGVARVDLLQQRGGFLVPAVAERLRQLVHQSKLAFQRGHGPRWVVLDPNAERIRWSTV